MTVDAYASQPHYVDHLAPVWNALDPARRGPFRVPYGALERYARQRLDAATRIEPGGYPNPRLAGTLVAGAIDLSQTYRAVLLEHGAGQTYRGVDHAAWAGGRGRDRVVLFVVPNETTARKNLDRYPDASAVICAPRVEQLRRIAAERIPADSAVRYLAVVRWSPAIVDETKAVVPELLAAWDEWKEPIRLLDGLALHAHPRVRSAVARIADYWDVPYYDRWDDAVRYCPDATLLVDNSSVAYEWAALDRPVVCLNSARYRLDVDHGLRFWDLIPGPAAFPGDLDADGELLVWDLKTAAWANGDPDTQLDILRTLADAAARPDWADERRRTVSEVFPVVDGSARIAADAIEGIFG